LRVSGLDKECDTGMITEKIVILKTKNQVVRWIPNNPDEKLEDIIKRMMRSFNIHPGDLISIVVDNTQIVFVYWEYEYKSILANDTLIADIKAGKVFFGYEIVKIIDLREIGKSQNTKPKITGILKKPSQFREDYGVF